MSQAARFSLVRGADSFALGPSVAVRRRFSLRSALNAHSSTPRTGLSSRPCRYPAREGRHRHSAAALARFLPGRAFSWLFIPARAGKRGEDGAKAGRLGPAERCRWRPFWAGDGTAANEPAFRSG